jgi:hypothetical protein
MAAQQQKKPKQVTLLDVRKVATVNGPKTKVVFPKGIEITFEGKPVDLGEYRSFFVKDKAEMEKDLNYLVDKEYMTQENADKERSFIEEKNIVARLKVPLT